MDKKSAITHKPLILALDTSSGTTSMAIARGEELIRSFTSQPAPIRSEKLWVEIESLLSRMGATINDVDLFTVCRGPGGFTGLRVGMAAVKGFALAARKPVVGVTSLEAAALAAWPAPAVCAMVNAYKSDVYSQLFSFDDDGVPVAQTEPLVSTVIEAVERVAQIDSVVFTGDGAVAGAEIIKQVGGERFGDEFADRPSAWSIKLADEALANQIARLAFMRYARGEVETAEGLRACYVRPAEAEIKLSLGLLGTKIQRSMRPE